MDDKLISFLTIVVAMNVAPIALEKPIPGAACSGSIHVLGETWPPSTSESRDRKKDIVDIRAIVDSTSPERSVVGWVYRLKDKQIFIEGRYESLAWQSIDSDLNGSAGPGIMISTALPVYKKLREAMKIHSLREIACFKGMLESE
jgi:hypothetical protein